MKLTQKLLAPLALVALPLLAAGQGVGSKLPVIELEGLAQTSAKSFDDYLGRAVLIEFFAYW
jgi:hypothetical protein